MRFHSLFKHEAVPQNSQNRASYIFEKDNLMLPDPSALTLILNRGALGDIWWDVGADYQGGRGWKDLDY